MAASLLIYLLTAIAVVLPRLSSQQRLRLGGLGCALASGTVATTAAIRLLTTTEATPPILRIASWPLGWVEFGGDSLSWFFSLIVGVLGTVASIYSLSYLRAKSESVCGRRDGGLADIGLPMLYLSVFLFSMHLVVLSRTVLAFMGSWELMALSSYLLIVQGNKSEKAQRAGFVYIVMTHIGAAFIAIAFMLLYASTGSFSFSIWSAQAGALPLSLRTVCFLLFAIGLATKGGLVPLQVWLPRAHPQAPSHVSALMSGVMVKTAVYGFIRFVMMTLGASPPWWGLLVVVVGLVSAVTGVLGSQSQTDMKRLLAYSTVENMGLIAVGLGLALLGHSLHLQSLATLGLTAALAHTLGHSLFKGLLFLGVGSVEHATGTRDLSLLGGLARVMPRTSLVLLVGVLAIAALPPFAGFVSEWYLIRSAFHLFVSNASPSYRMVGFLTASGIALTGGIAAAAFLRFYGIAFLGRPRSEWSGQAHEAAAPMLVPMLTLAALCFLLGVIPGIALRLIRPVVLASGVSPLVMGRLGIPLGAVLLSPFLIGGAVALVFRLSSRPRDLPRSETWNCGFELQPQMQYSSGGFSQPFARVFRFKPILEQRVYRPLRDRVIVAASGLRRLQSGSIQAYIAYILATLIVLIAVNR